MVAKRQLFPGVMTMVVAALLASVQMAAGQGAMAPANTARLEVTVDSSAKQIVLLVGPFHLIDRSGEDTHAHSGAGHDTPVYHFDWPIEGWLRGFQLEVVDGQDRAGCGDDAAHARGTCLEPDDHAAGARLGPVGYDRRQCESGRVFRAS